MGIYPGNKIEQACKRVGSPLSPSDHDTCEFCGRTLGESRIHYCAGGETVCVNCFQTCVACGEGHCPDCIVDCGECGKHGCTDCLVICKKCLQWFCRDHHIGHSLTCKGYSST